MTMALVGGISFLLIGLTILLMARTSLDFIWKVLKYLLIMAVLAGVLFFLVRACSRSVPLPRAQRAVESRVIQPAKRSIAIPPMPVMQVSMTDKIKNMLVKSPMQMLLPESAPPPPPKVYTYQRIDFSGAVEAVYTGSVFKVSGHIVKLYGIDAPILEQRCVNATGSWYDCGRLSRQMLGNMIKGQTISCQTVIEDELRNYVATCRLGSKDIASEMVSQGWAVINRRTTSLYAGEEERARRNGLGLWGGRFMMPAKYRALKNQMPTLQFHPKQFKKPHKWGWF